MGNSWTAKGKKKKTFFEFEFGSNSPKTRVRGMDGGNDRVRRVRLVLYGRRRRHETRGKKKEIRVHRLLIIIIIIISLYILLRRGMEEKKKTVFFFVYTSARANFFFRFSFNITFRRVRVPSSLPTHGAPK